MENAIGADRGSFWTVFHDGESEFDLGMIEIYSTITLKEFQHLMCQRMLTYPGIRLNPNQFLIYLVRMTCFPEDQVRIQITSKVNFEFIVRQKDTSYFDVILKKPKRSYAAAALGYYYNTEIQSPADSTFQIYDYPFHTFEPLDVASIINDRWQRELAMVGATPRNDILVSDPDLGPGFLNNGREKIEEKGKVFCKECAKAEKDEETGIGSFHCCVNDQVIERFRTSAGPIARPIKVSEGPIVLFVPPKP